MSIKTPYYTRTLDSFADEIITRISLGIDDRTGKPNGYYYAVLDIGPQRYVSDPDFSTCAKSPEEAVKKCADRIRANAKGIGKHAPENLLTENRYDFRWRLAKHWARKEDMLASLGLPPAALLSIDGATIPGTENSAVSDRRVYTATELSPEWRQALSFVKNNPPANLPKDDTDIETPAPISRGWRP